MREKEVATTLTEILGPALGKDVPLALHITLRAGGPARFFAKVDNLETLIKAARFAFEISLPLKVIGTGSNILFGDRGFEGLVLKVEAARLHFDPVKNQVIAEAGAKINRLILEGAARGLAGLEFLYGIPASLGGAVYQNAGSFGGSFGDHLIFATLLTPQGETVQWQRADFDYDYRHSCLHDLPPPKPVILSAKIQLAKSKPEEIQRRIQHYGSLRAKKQPAAMSAGSFFKNPKVEAEWAMEYLKRVGERRFEVFDSLKKSGRLPAGWLIEQAGGKGLRYKAAFVHEQHANFLVNRGGKATAAELRMLAKMVRERVFEKFGIVLEEEVEYAGEW